MAKQSGNSIIQVRNVRRSFKSVSKEEGMKGTFGLLFKPQYKEHEALKGVSCDIEHGEFVGLIGANGAGKTTLLKILSGLIPASSGEARVLGIDPFTRPMDFRRKIALVMGQKAQLWWDLPALDAFHLLRAIYDIPEKTYRERLNELAKLLDVEKLLQTQIRRLSLGERMKMELIGALIHWPQVVFLDEPTIGLDVLAAHKLREFLKVFNEKEKATIILTSHNMDDIERLCPRVMILKTGEMIYDGSSRGLTREGECRLRVSLKENPELVALASAAGVPLATVTLQEKDEEDAGDLRSFAFSTTQKDAPRLLSAIMAKYQIVNMGFDEQNLESVIQRIYETGGREAGL